MSLQTAGHLLLARPGDDQGGTLFSPFPFRPTKTLGVKSLRHEYLKLTSRSVLEQNLQLIEEQWRLTWPEAAPSPALPVERELPRFKHAYGEALLPLHVFTSALELEKAEILNGQALAFDVQVLMLRDNLVAAYKPLCQKVRMVVAKEIEACPRRVVLSFVSAWFAWESAWLRNREIHAVEALQPLAKAILSLEPLLISVRKERLLPWPRVQHQKVVTLKCLEGFMCSLAELAGSVLPSLQRDVDHDPRLLLLMEHVLKLRGDVFKSCLDGVSQTPEVTFPDPKFPTETSGRNALPFPSRSSGACGRAGPEAITPTPTSSTSTTSSVEHVHSLYASELENVTVDAYAFKLMGLSSGDAEAWRSLEERATGTRSLSHGKSLQRRSASVPPGVVREPQAGRDASVGRFNKESVLSQRAARHAVELLSAFEHVKDMLLSLKTTLEFIDPALDRDRDFVESLQRLERALKRSKCLFLAPDNLA